MVTTLTNLVIRVLGVIGDKTLDFIKNLWCPAHNVTLWQHGVFQDKFINPVHRIIVKNLAHIIPECAQPTIAVPWPKAIQVVVPYLGFIAHGADFITNGIETSCLGNTMRHETLVSRCHDVIQVFNPVLFSIDIDVAILSDQIAMLLGTRAEHDVGQLMQVNTPNGLGINVLVLIL